MLTTVGAALAAIHFGSALTYYAAAKRWLKRPWGLAAEDPELPRVTVVVPTYNEARHIGERLEDIYRQDYPHALMEVIVADGASTDGTAEAAERWAERHPDLAVKVLRERERRGKSASLNEALKAASGEVVVIADADARWAPDALRRAVEKLRDPQVGAVTCVKRPAAGGPAGVEAAYRDYYNLLRVAESKKWATPIFHGELAAFRRDLLEGIGGFPPGADDSGAATAVALMGYRAIAADDVICVEAVPKGYWQWRVRRAQHLVDHFWRTLRRIGEAPPPFRPVLAAEAWLHLFNPWLLPASIALLALAAASGSLAAAALLGLGAAATASRQFRTWAAMQIYLIAAALRNLKDKQYVWQKDDK